MRTYLYNICSIRSRHKIKGKIMLFGKIKTSLCYTVVDFVKGENRSRKTYNVTLVTYVLQ